MAAVAVAGSVEPAARGCSKADDSGGARAKGAGANAATKGVVNASTRRAARSRYATPTLPDSLDPGNTYYALRATTSAASTRVR